MEEKRDCNASTSQRSDERRQTKEKEETFSLSRYIISMIEKRRWEENGFSRRYRPAEVSRMKRRFRCSGENYYETTFTAAYSCVRIELKRPGHARGCEPIPCRTPTYPDGTFKV